jgi:hypothetical protein
MKHTATNIVEIAIGTTLILITMTTSATPLGGLAVLPLIGIVPILFGLFGVHFPSRKLVARTFSHLREQTVHAVERIKHSSAHTA